MPLFKYSHLVKKKFQNKEFTHRISADYVDV